MKYKKKIGITTRLVNAVDYDEPRDAISHDWIRFLNGIETDPVIIPNMVDDPVGFFARKECDLLILSNGGNVELEKNIDGSYSGNIRDITEAKLLGFAIENNIPVLGVCRGLQFINVFFGGKLTSSIKGHVAKMHEVQIIDEGFKQLIGLDSIIVNSYHNMGVLREDMSADFIAWAETDNVVEGIYHEKYPIIAVQWHPERKGCEVSISKKILDKLLSKKED